MYLIGVDVPPKIFHDKGRTWIQSFGSGSVRIRIRFVSWIRIRIPNADPDPAADEITVAPKAQKIPII